MSNDKPDLYAGLDQMIAKPTKPSPSEPTTPEPVQPDAPEPVARATTGSPVHESVSRHLEENETHLVRQLEPDLPDEPYLYRKQTLDFGPKDLEAVEFLSKDCDAHAEQSFLVRKFIKEVVTLP